MEHIRALGHPYLALASVGTLGAVLLLVLAMGLFGKNHMPVEGRTILMTGGSDGMGRSAARQLAAKGASVVVVARNVGRLEEVVAEMQAAAKSPQTQRFHYIAADVAERGYAARVVAEVITWNGGRAPDVVWCVAGMTNPILFTDDDAVDSMRQVTDVNLFGSAEMAHAILREWLAPGGPEYEEPKHLVFTASVLALYALVGYSTYNPSKWALRGLADTLAQEVMLYPRQPVRVHVVYPGTILSGSFEREQLTKPDVTKHLERDDPQQTPDEVAERAIRGLEAGHHFVTVGLLGELMRWGVMGGSLRNNWVVDTLMAFVLALAWPVVHWVMHGDIRKWAREHGHPATWPKKR